MKLRQKLAVALATAMAVTTVPVITMAASSNSLVKSVIKVKEDTNFMEASTAPALRIKFNEVTGGQKEVFYLTLKNAEWTTEQVRLMNEAIECDNGSVEITRQGSKTARVSYNPAHNETDQVLRLPIFVQAKGGDATIAIETQGSTSTSVSEGSWVFASTVDEDEVATVTCASPKAIYKSGEIADITFKEAFTGAIGTDTYMAKVDINHGDFEFSLPATMKEGSTKYKVTKKSGTYKATSDKDGDYYKYILDSTYVEYKYGFADGGNSNITVYLSSDGDSMYVELNGGNKTPDSIGQIKLKNLKVKSTEKAPKEGDLTIDVEGDVEDATLTVAKVAAYGVSISTEDDKIEEVIGGRNEDVTFILSENVDDSFTKDREVTFKLDKGYFTDKGSDDDERLDMLVENMKIKIYNDGDLEKTISDADVLKEIITDFDTSDDSINNFEITIPADWITSDIDEIKIETEVYAKLDSDGDVKLSVEGRGITDTAEGVIAKIIRPFTITMDEAATLKVGLKDQFTGKLTIKESDSDMFRSGEFFYITLPTDKGMTYEDEPTVKVTSGDLELDDIDTCTYNGDSAIKFKVKRASNTASTVEITNFKITADRTVPQGSYNVNLKGPGVSENADWDLEVKDFIVIGTPNTEDIASSLASNGLEKATVKFVVGETKYTVNDESKTMDAASYIQAPGYTMIPMRYVAEAFGVPATDIVFSNGTATFFAGTRTIQLTNGSDVAVVNGASVKLGTKVVVKDGRTYVPVGEIARILGIATNWDSSTKTATFENK